jgi:AcrR family transcriptional regulator
MSKEKRYQPAIVPSQRPGKEDGARARNRRQRTQALCEAALSLFLSRGIESTTVDEITRSAGVAKGSFYRYFNDKTDLVDALLSPLEVEMRAAMERCEAALSKAEDAAELSGAYAALARELGVLLLSSPDVVKLYLQEARTPGEGAREPLRRVRAEVRRGAVSLTQTAHRRGLLEDLPVNVTAVAVVGAVEGMIAAYFDGEDLGDPVVATDALLKMVLDGIRRV